MIFYVVAGISFLGMILTVITPKPKHEAVAAEQLEPTVAPSTAAMAATAGQARASTTRSRSSSTRPVSNYPRRAFPSSSRSTGHKIHLVYLAAERVIGGDASGSVLGGNNDVDIDPQHVANLQEYVDQVSQRVFRSLVRYSPRRCSAAATPSSTWPTNCGPT